MEQWDSVTRPVRRGYPPHVVQQFCVRQPGWQRFRISLKGCTTRMKLLELAEWYDGLKYAALVFSKYEREVQVGNYLGALRRGGQLDAENRVKRTL